MANEQRAIYMMPENHLCRVACGIHVRTVTSFIFFVKQEQINEIAANVPVAAVVGVVVTVLTVLTVGVVKEADVPVVPLVVLAVVCDSMVKVVGVVALSMTHTHNFGKSQNV